jgi:hypothetical protein
VAAIGAAVAWGAAETIQRVLTGWYVTAQNRRTESIPALPAAGLRLPFELVTHHIMLQASVGSARSLAFALDTGDRFAALDLERARALGVALGAELSVAGAGSQRTKAAFVRDAEFGLAGFSGFAQPIHLALPLRPLTPRLGQDCDGIIGTEFLRRFVVEIDYLARTLTLHDPAEFVYRGTGESIPMRLDGEGHPVIQAEVTLDGSEPIRGGFLLDIGANSALVLHSPLVRARQLPGPRLKTMPPLDGGGTGGALRGRIGRVAALSIGARRLPQPPTLFSEDAAGAYANSDLQGSIGARVASRFKLVLDYAHERIVFEPSAAVDEPFGGVSSGLRLEAEGSDYRTFRVKQVADASPAAEAGLQPEDLIRAVDDRAAAEWTLSRLLDTFERTGSHTLTVARGAQSLQLQLTPRPII